MPLIVDLERKTIALMSKQAMMLIERRRQDVRDQAKEIAEIGSEFLVGRHTNPITAHHFMYF